MKWEMAYLDRIKIGCGGVSLKKSAKENMQSLGQTLGQPNSSPGAAHDALINCNCAFVAGITHTPTRCTLSPNSELREGARLEPSR